MEFAVAAIPGRGSNALTMESQSESKSPKDTTNWRSDGRPMLAIFGSVAFLFLRPLRCLKKSNAIVWTKGGRVLTLKIGSHGLELTIPFTFIIVAEVGK